MKYLPGNKHCKAIVFGHLDQYREPYLRAGKEPFNTIERDIEHINKFIFNYTMNEFDCIEMAAAYRQQKLDWGYVI